MRRIEMMELHDHPAFPASLRDLVTDALEALWEFGNSYKPILPMLHEGISGHGLSAEKEAEVLDLCSGGGGPWTRLAQEYRAAYGVSLRICLTGQISELDRFRTDPVAELGVGFERCGLCRDSGGRDEGA